MVSRGRMLGMFNQSDDLLEDFESCIIRAVNLLGDADTIGAIAGQMAGAV